MKGFVYGFWNDGPTFKFFYIQKIGRAVDPIKPSNRRPKTWHFWVKMLRINTLEVGKLRQVRLVFYKFFSETWQKTPFLLL